jgi:hypothetical protein
MDNYGLIFRKDKWQIWKRANPSSIQYSDIEIGDKFISAHKTRISADCKLNILEKDMFVQYDWKILQNGLQVSAGFAPSAERRDMQIRYYIASYRHDGPLIVKIRDGAKGKWKTLPANNS